MALGRVADEVMVEAVGLEVPSAVLQELRAERCLLAASPKGSARRVRAPRKSGGRMTCLAAGKL